MFGYRKCKVCHKMIQNHDKVLEYHMQFDSRHRSLIIPALMIDDERHKAPKEYIKDSYFEQEVAN